MNTNLETIENYLTGQLPADERTRFEAALRDDPALADALSFYVLTKQVARAEAREQRLAEFDTLRRQRIRTDQQSLGGWVTYVAAAASIVLLLGLGWYFLRPTSVVVADKQVDTYVSEHFMELPATMDGGSADSLKLGVNLFNKGQLAEADVVFQDVLTRHPETDSALKYAGIVAFRQGDYDKAITLFHRLSQRPDLFANPGLFYESLALLKRGRPMDKSQVKKLLDEVINKNLEGKSEAERIMTSL